MVIELKKGREKHGGTQIAYPPSNSSFALLEALTRQSAMFEMKG